MPDCTIDQPEIQGPIQIRRPLTTPAKIQTALDVSQKCSHIYNPLASKVIDLRVRKERATSSPRAILLDSSAFPVLLTKQRLLPPSLSRYRTSVIFQTCWLAIHFQNSHHWASNRSNALCAPESQRWRCSEKP